MAWRSSRFDLYDSPVVVLSIGQPPGSTLFPYTTLFRSGKVDAHDAARALGAAAADGVIVRVDSREGRTEVTLARSGEDRKSTRLNSSHSQISYAVFCLKKKHEGWRQHYSSAEQKP